MEIQIHDSMGSKQPRTRRLMVDSFTFGLAYSLYIGQCNMWAAILKTIYRVVDDAIQSDLDCLLPRYNKRVYDYFLWQIQASVLTVSPFVDGWSP